MIYYGAQPSDGVSQHLKVYITSEDLSVCGYIGQGAAMQIASMWNSPFEGDNAGSIAGAETASNMIQSASKNTSVSRWNSLMVWQGAQPPSITMPVELIAFNDPQLEVNNAIRALCSMISPQLEDTMPGGRRPHVCTVDIGRRFMLADVVIQDVSYPLDSPKSPEGYYLSSTVSLQLSGMAVQNRSEISGLFI